MSYFYDYYYYDDDYFFYGVGREMVFSKFFMNQLARSAVQFN